MFSSFPLNMCRLLSCSITVGTVSWLCYLLQQLHGSITAVIWQSVALICIRLHAHRGKLSLMSSIILCRWQKRKHEMETQKWSASSSYCLSLADCCSDDIDLCFEIFSTAQSRYITITTPSPNMNTLHRYLANYHIKTVTKADRPWYYHFKINLSFMVVHATSAF